MSSDDDDALISAAKLHITADKKSDKIPNDNDSAEYQVFSDDDDALISAAKLHITADKKSDKTSNTGSAAAATSSAYTIPSETAAAESNPDTVPTEGVSAAAENTSATPAQFISRSFPAMPLSPEQVMQHFEVPPVFSNPLPQPIQHFLRDNSQTIHAIGRRRKQLTLQLRSMKDQHDR